MYFKHWLLPSLFLLNLLAAWPHWLWLARRANDGSDDPWGIVALLTLAILVWRDKEVLRLPNKTALVGSALLTILASVSWGILPPIMATALAMLGLTSLIIGMLPKQRPLAPLLMLSLLALPLAASFNFYLGYPLRWFCAHVAVHVLSALGVMVTAQGAALTWNGQTVLVDAPCAGIAMLWIGLYLATLLSYLNASGAVRSCVNLAAAVVVVAMANVLRNTLLFYKEAGIVHLPHWTHEAIGLLLFGLIVPVIYWFCTVFYPSGERHEAR